MELSIIALENPLLSDFDATLTAQEFGKFSVQNHQGRLDCGYLYEASFVTVQGVYDVTKLKWHQASCLKEEQFQTSDVYLLELLFLGTLVRVRQFTNNLELLQAQS